MRHLKTLASALALVLVVLMATDYVAMAATGKPLILGKVNKSGKTTTIKSTKGAALSLKAKPGQPPLKVNSTTVVPNLNAGLVGGKSAAELGVRTRVYRMDLPNATRTEFTMTIPAVPAGTYLATIDGWIYAPAGHMFCYLRAPGGGDRPQDYIEGTDGFYAISAAGVISVSPAGALTMKCQGVTGAMRTFNGFQVSLTPIDTVSSLPSTFARTKVTGKSAITK